MKITHRRLASAAIALAFLAACQPAVAPAPAPGTTTPGATVPPGGGFGQAPTLPPAAPPMQAGILGTWRCGVSEGGTTLTASTTYNPGGQFTSNAQMTGSTPQGQLSLQITANGDWTYQNNQITETARAFNIVQASLNGAPIQPGTDMYNNMSAGMNSQIGTPNVRTVTNLTATSMTVTESTSGQSTTCTRG